jgi:YD repeat-containing protein
MTIIDNQVSGASISKYEYAYDVLGRRADRIQSGSAINSASTDTFSYNSRDEVTGSTNNIEIAAQYNPTYNYDKIGNRTSSTGVFEANYTSNELNQYSVVTALSAVNNLTYDLDGNLTSDGGNWTYTWNSENRLVSATNGTTTLNFTYDYQGRLVKKDDGSNMEVYVYDGWNRIAAFKIHSSLFTLHSSYLWGLDLSGTMQGAGGVGGLLKEGDLYPTFDANGNILQKLDSEGTVVMSVDYDPFGNMIEGTLVGEYGFSTKPLINDLDWYYYGFRYYDPVTG